MEAVIRQQPPPDKSVYHYHFALLSRNTDQHRKFNHIMMLHDNSETAVASRCNGKQQAMPMCMNCRADYIEPTVYQMVACCAVPQSSYDKYKHCDREGLAVHINRSNREVKSAS